MLLDCIESGEEGFFVLLLAPTFKPRCGEVLLAHCISSVRVESPSTTQLRALGFAADGRKLVAEVVGEAAVVEEVEGEVSQVVDKFGGVGPVGAD